MPDYATVDMQLPPADEAHLPTERVFITNIRIDKVRHLRDIEFAVSEGDMPRHVLFTGKNGSGKTSVLDAISVYLDEASKGNTPLKYRRLIAQNQNSLAFQEENGSPEDEIYNTQQRIAKWQSKLENCQHGVELTFNVGDAAIQPRFEQGECIFAYFKAQRAFAAEEPKVIEKVELQSRYGINETPRSLFIKYMLDLKMTQALAAANGRQEKADEVARWFNGLQAMLREIYEDDTLTVDFDEDTYRFNINAADREPFDFNSASDGFSAVLDIVAGLMLRMTPNGTASPNLQTPGIVLVDEIENHLHLSLQKRILPFLTALFPCVQFVVTTHSPFVVSSVDDAVIYDLENHSLAKDGLSANTYASIVEGFFNVDELSAELRGKYERYKAIAGQASLSDDDLVEIAELETYLDEIPDYLALGIATEYKRLKLEMRTKGISQ